MDLISVLGIIARRFYLVLPILVGTGIVLYLMVSALEREYEASGSVLLTHQDVIPPEPETEEPQPTFRNPYEDLGTAATALTEIIESRPMRTQVEDQGLSPDYDIDAGRVVEVEVTADSEERAVSTAEHVLGLIDETLVDLQGATAAPESQWVESRLLVAPTAEAIPYSGVRSIAIVAFLGVTAAIASAFVGESVARSIRRYRARRAAEADAQSEAQARLVSAHGTSEDDLEGLDSELDVLSEEQGGVGPSDGHEPDLVRDRR